MRMSRIKCSLKIDKVELLRKIILMSQCFYLKTLQFQIFSSKTLTLFIILTQIRSTQSFQSNILNLNLLFPRKSCQFTHFQCKVVLKTISKDKCEHSQFRIIMSSLKLILRISQESTHSGKDLLKDKEKIFLQLRIKQLQLLVVLLLELQLM